jgi:hypothetical protein
MLPPSLTVDQALWLWRIQKQEDITGIPVPYEWLDDDARDAVGELTSFLNQHHTETGLSFTINPLGRIVLKQAMKANGWIPVLP